MRKNLFLLATLLCVGAAIGQVKEKGAIEITPKLGYSSYAEVTSKGNTNSKSGIAIAVTADFYLSNRWSLRSGFSLDQMGSKTNAQNFIGEDKLNYFTIPVNANWHFGSTRKWNLNFGLSPSFLTSASYVENGVEREFPKEVIKSFQLGVSYGIGYKIEITKKFGILLESQFFSGVTEIAYISNNSFKNAGGSYNIGGVIQL